MKVSILVLSLAMLMALACAWKPFEFDTQHDMLEYMRDENHNMYVILFYNSDQGSREQQERMRRIVLQERESIRRGVLEVFDNVVYAELDTAGGQYDEVAHEIGVETADTLEYPTVVAVADGVGKWVHGPNLSQILIPTLKALVLRRDQ